ncbi:MAG: putative metal-binding motif-containing protein [Nanoarchaeota archaeon]
MKRGSNLFLVLGILIIVLSLSVVSASWFSDIFGKITGQPVKVVDDGSFVGSTASTPSCTDSDGGLNYILKGTVYGQDSNFTNYFFNDTCSGNYVVEYYCNQNTSGFAYVTYSCANLGANYVCSNGVCQQTTGCIDNDADTFFSNCGSFLDCNDNNALERPGQIWYSDLDKDRYGNGAYLVQCLRPLNYYTSSELISATGDCADNNANINPGKAEVCSDGIDNNCNAQIDEGCGNSSGIFDLATTSITFSDNTPEVGQLIMIAKTVKNLGNVNGYITGGSASTCLLGDPSGCAGGGWGGSPGTLILAGEIKNYYENYTFNKAGTWELKRSYNGKGIHNESDINPVNNLKTVYINVSGNTTTVTCTDSDGGYDYNIQGTATYQGQTYNDYCVLNGTYAGWVYEYACNSGVLGTGVYNCASSGGVCSNGACVSSNNTFSWNPFYLTYISYPGSSFLDVIWLGDVQTYLSNKNIPSLIVDSRNVTRQIMLNTTSVIVTNKSSLVVYPRNWVSYLYAIEAGNIQTYLKSYVDSHLGFRTCNQLISAESLTSDNFNDAFSLCTSWYGFSNNQTLSCSDSDGGWYPYAKGTATITSGSQSLKYADFCVAGNGTGNTLHEYSCSENNTLNGGNFNCPYGCLNGVCKSSTSKCTFFGRIFKSAACKAVAEKDVRAGIDN